jgi:hypothetical protein
MRNEMKNYRMWKGIKIGMFAVAGSVVLGLALKGLWNWLMPGIFHLGTITFWQALGLLILSKILFGGFHRHAGGRRGWKRHREERWAGMTAAERERFQAGMRGRDCGFGRRWEAGKEAGGEPASR